MKTACSLCWLMTMSWLPQASGTAPAGAGWPAVPLGTIVSHHARLSRMLIRCKHQPAVRHDDVSCSPCESGMQSMLAHDVVMVATRFRHGTSWCKMAGSTTGHGCEPSRTPLTHADTMQTSTSCDAQQGRWGGCAVVVKAAWRFFLCLATQVR